MTVRQDVYANLRITLFNRRVSQRRNESDVKQRIADAIKSRLCIIVSVSCHAQRNKVAKAGPQNQRSQIIT